MLAAVLSLRLYLGNLLLDTNISSNHRLAAHPIKLFNHAAANCVLESAGGRLQSHRNE